MRLSRTGVAAMAAALLTVGVAPAQWTTIKGQIVLPEAAVPKPVELNVTADKGHCLSKGPLVDDQVIVNPKNRGLKNVWVYLKPAAGEVFAANQLPAAAAKSKEHTIDQPCCQFVPRIFAMRSGDTLVVKNSSPVAHNINVSADDPSPSFNPVIPPGGAYTAPKPFVAQKGLVTFNCNIHPWMGGKFMVFDHPYYAVTDADGKFEIKDAPAGAVRIFYRHESGYHMGKNGGKGFPLILAGATQTLDPLNYEFPPVTK